MNNTIYTIAIAFLNIWSVSATATAIQNPLIFYLRRDNEFKRKKRENRRTN